MRQRILIDCRATRLAIGLLGMIAGVVSAQEVRDPTEPPAVLRAPGEAGVAADGQAGIAGVGRPVPVVALQEAIHGRWRGRAVVAGQLVRAGDSVGAAEVTAVHQDAVTLATEDEAITEPIVDHGVIKQRPGDFGHDITERIPEGLMRHK